jgi:hypothetical protein
MAQRTSKSWRGNRYEESVAAYERRQRRDKILGTVGLVVGGLVLLLNLIMEFDTSVLLLPGGHSELYFLASILVLGYAAWVRFDLGLDRRERR